jgi:hypothetical protein
MSRICFPRTTTNTVPDNLEGDISEPPTRVSTVAVLAHVKTRREIYRLTLLDSVEPELFQLAEIAATMNPHPGDTTIGVALSWKGIVHPNRDFRPIGGASSLSRSGPSRLSRLRRAEPIRQEEGKQGGHEGQQERQLCSRYEPTGLGI